MLYTTEYWDIYFTPFPLHLTKGIPINSLAQRLHCGVIIEYMHGYWNEWPQLVINIWLDVKYSEFDPVNSHGLFVVIINFDSL